MIASAGSQRGILKVPWPVPAARPVNWKELAERIKAPQDRTYLIALPRDRCIRAVPGATGLLLAAALLLAQAVGGALW